MASNSSEESQQSFLAGTYTSGDLLFVRAITPLHVGVGRAGGIVDLPVQKDLYGYPIIYASSLKGALRSLCIRVANKNTCVKLFGTEPGVTPTEPGKVMVLDVQLLLIPVRLLKGVYGYVTSPFMLRRLADYLEVKDENKANQLYGLAKKLASKLKDSENVIVSDSERMTIGERGEKYLVVNEEFWLKPIEDEENVLRTIISIMPGQLTNKLELEENRLLIVSDSNDLSIQIIEKSLLRLQRIRLKEEAKIVETGALWSEEYVPRNAVFYTLVLYTDNNVKESFTGMLSKIRKYLILGGNETIGKGLTELYIG